MARKSNSTNAARGRPPLLKRGVNRISIEHAPLELKAALMVEAAERGEPLSLYVARILSATTPDIRAALADQVKVDAA